MGKFLDHFLPQTILRRREVYLGLRWVLLDGLFAQGMETLVIGPFMVAYALQFGASNLLIGVLAAVPSLAQFAQIPGVYLVERFRRRKLITILGTALNRPALLMIAAAALLPWPELSLTVIIAAYFMRYSLGGMAATAWNSWMRDLVPQEILGRFFANRLTWMAAIATGVSLAAAAFVDYFGRQWPDQAVYGLSILFVAAFLSGCACVYCMTRVPEPAMEPSVGVSFFREVLPRPFRDSNFRKLLYFLGSWNFAVNLAAPFFTVYLLERLRYDLTIVVMLTVLSQISNIITLKTWGRITDRFTNKSVLSVAAPLLLVCIFAWTLTTLPEKHALTLPLLVLIHIFTGIATAGITLASGNIGLKLAPMGQGAAYLAASGLITNLAAAIAPIIGGMSVDFFTSKEFSLTLRWASESQLVAFNALSIRHWDFLFLAAVVIGIFSIHRLSLVTEGGEVGERLIVHELMMASRRSIRTFSTFAGLRTLGAVPLGIILKTKRKGGPRRRNEP